MSDGKSDLEKEKKDPDLEKKEMNPDLENEKKDPTAVATVITTQPSEVVVVQPVRALPGHWSVGELNAPCCITMCCPCVGLYWAVSNGRKAGLPGFCESQGCCFIAFCCCFACHAYAFKARLLTQMRLGIRGDRNEMLWHGLCYPCYLGQTKKTLDDNADIMAAPFDKNDIVYNVISTL